MRNLVSQLCGLFKRNDFCQHYCGIVIILGCGFRCTNVIFPFSIKLSLDGGLLWLELIVELRAQPVRESLLIIGRIGGLRLDVEFSFREGHVHRMSCGSVYCSL